MGSIAMPTGYTLAGVAYSHALILDATTMDLSGRMSAVIDVSAGATATVTSYPIIAPGDIAVYTARSLWGQAWLSLDA